MLRRAVAEEAARLMIEHGVDDFGTAKRKAAERFGVTEHAVLPKNAEIESALVERQRLFSTGRHTTDLAALRRAAINAMRLLDSFHPRLVGPVLSGSATPHAEIEVHVFADSVEAVVLALLDAGIAHRLVTRRFKPRSQRDEPVPYPALRLEISGHDVEATVFPEVGLRQAPISPVDGRPMRRATTAEIEELLAAGRIVDQLRPDSGT
jgi:hypothetical protein